MLRVRSTDRFTSLLYFIGRSLQVGIIYYYYYIHRMHRIVSSTSELFISSSTNKKTVILCLTWYLNLLSSQSDMLIPIRSVTR